MVWVLLGALTLGVVPVAAGQAVAAMRAGWNLGNALDGFGLKQGDPIAFETYWGNPEIQPSLFKTVREAGFTAVRIPITWWQKMDRTYQVDPAWMDRVAEVVDMALGAGLYCIINVHHDTGRGNRWLHVDGITYDAVSAQFAALWTQIAERFAQYDERLLFECMNEITDLYSSYGTAGSRGGTPEEAEEAYHTVNALNQLFVDTVRDTGGNNPQRNLICSPYYASVATEALERFEMPQDATEDHLILGVHTYYPMGLTMHMEGIGGDHGQPDVFGKAEKAVMDRTYDLLRTRFVEKGYPVIIGEFGVVDRKNLEQRLDYVRYIVEKTVEIGGAYFWWDNGIRTEFKLLNRERETWVFPEILKALVE